MIGPSTRRRATATRVVAVVAFLTAAGTIECLPPAWADREIVARLNGEPVTRDEVQRVIGDAVTRGELQRELGGADGDGKDLAQLALRLVIKRRLILEEAARRHVAVPEQEIDEAVATLRRRFPDLQTFGAWMKDRGLDDRSLFEAIRADLTVTRVRAGLVADLRVTDEQVSAYYHAHRTRLRTPDTVRLVIIQAPDTAQGQRVLARVQLAEDFDLLADDRVGSRDRGIQRRHTGWVNLATLPTSLRDAVGSMKVGEIGGPVRVGGDVLVVRLEERRRARRQTLTEARPDIERHLLALAQRDLLRGWLAEREKRSTIEFLQ